MLELDRRQFLQSSCAAAAVAVVGLPAAFAEPRYKVMEDFVVGGFVKVGDDPWEHKEASYRAGDMVTERDLSLSPGADSEAYFTNLALNQGLVAPMGATTISLGLGGDQPLFDQVYLLT